MQITLVYKDEQSNKFWKVERRDSKLVIHFGKVDTAGRMQVKEFASAEACEAEAEKLIRAKLKKGYKPLTCSMQVMKDSTMSEDLFWELIKKAKTKLDVDEQMEWLRSTLAKRSEKDIFRFDQLLNQHFDQSYTSSLWAAAYIVMGGCSDDCFDYFRAWLLYQGKDIYYKAIESPETMISVLQPLEAEGYAPQLEELLAVACEAYEEKTGLDNDYYYDKYDQFDPIWYDEQDLDLDWDEDDEDGLQMRFPVLWSRYWNNHLEY